MANHLSQRVTFEGIKQLEDGRRDAFTIAFNDPVQAEFLPVVQKLRRNFAEHIDMRWQWQEGVECRWASLSCGVYSMPQAIVSLNPPQSNGTRRMLLQSAHDLRDPLPTCLQFVLSPDGQHLSGGDAYDETDVSIQTRRKQGPPGMATGMNLSRQVGGDDFGDGLRSVHCRRHRHRAHGYDLELQLQDTLRIVMEVIGLAAGSVAGLAGIVEFCGKQIRLGRGSRDSLSEEQKVEFNPETRVLALLRIKVHHKSERGNFTVVRGMKYSIEVDFDVSVAIATTDAACERCRRLTEKQAALFFQQQRLPFQETVSDHALA